MNATLSIRLRCWTNSWKLCSSSKRTVSLTAYIAQGPEWEHLDFGIRPASYDDGYNPVLGDRPDLFFDPRLRQAFAYCADRQGIVDEHPFWAVQVPAGFLPPSHPNFLADLTPLPFDH
jgi:peptide/nickel transport system substrate-binding protein